ncbi:MAG: PTS sugar transporter subunit IIA [Candidatus Dadabacteria bacterium]|jgi:mannose PTS system EIIA component|nr:PTS sugar transporter subunit IIA [Candidatus Dadabacteria bacterium]
MVGIVVVTHGELAKELISAVNFVLSSNPSVKMEGVCLDPDREFESFKQEIKNAIKKVKGKDGILLVTDMFGGTPSNISLTFLDENNIEVISGVNLPMLLKLATLSDKVTLMDAVKIAEAAGRDNIIVASQLLKNRNQ